MKFNFTLPSKVPLKFYKSHEQANKHILDTLFQIKNFLAILHNFFSHLTNPQKLSMMKFNFAPAGKVFPKICKSLVQTNKAKLNTLLPMKYFQTTLHNFFFPTSSLPKNYP